MPAGTVVEADVCVVGAGAAGITLARALARSSLRICVLESGGLSPARAGERLLLGEVVGQPYPPLHRVRSAAFGGTTNRWVGTCRPLEELDFEPRSWVPLSGWPFSRSELVPYYARAQQICQAGAFTYDQDAEEGPDPLARRLGDPRVRTVIFRMAPPTRFGREYRAELARAGGVTVLLRATVLELEGQVGLVEQARVAGSDGQTFRVSAPVFVLAGGGLENPRLLLGSYRTRAVGLGNEHDLVGRCFMEHPTLCVGFFEPTVAGWSALLDRPDHAGGVAIERALALSADAMQQEQLLSLNLCFRARVSPVRAVLRRLRDSARWRLIPDHLWLRVTGALERVATAGGQAGRKASARPRRARRGFDLVVRAEQAPNPDSRVTLAGTLDGLGRPRARLDWRLTAFDRRSIRRSAEILGEALGGVGRVHLQDVNRMEPAGLYHHMGTTRMHRDPRHGVVDEDCRVHGLANLFVAGSSVFPTGGHANPTLTIVALALRLADHLGRRLG